MTEPVPTDCCQVDALADSSEPRVTAAGASSKSVTDRVVRSSGIVTIGNVSSRAISLVLGIVLGRSLTTAEFGAFGLVQSTTMMLNVIATMSLGLAASRNVALWHSKDPSRACDFALGSLAIGTITTGLVCCATFIAARAISVHLIGAPVFAGLIRTSTGLLAGTALLGIVLGVLTGLGRFGAMSLLSIFQNILVLIGSALLIPVFRVNGAVFGHILGITATLAIAVYVMFRSIGRPHWNRFGNWHTTVRTLLAFSGPTALGGALILLATWAASVIVTRQPGGLEEVGYFAAADRLRAIQLFVAGFIGTALLPVLADSLDHSGLATRDTRDGVEVSVGSTAILVVPLACILACAGPQLMSLYGIGYRSQWKVLLITVAWGAIAATSSTLGIAVWASGRLLKVLITQVVAAAALILAAFYLRGIGAIGLATAQLISAEIVYVGVCFVAHENGLLSGRALRTYIVSPHLACAVCAVSWISPDALRLPAAVPVGAAAAVFSMFAFLTQPQRAAMSALAGQVLTHANAFSLFTGSSRRS